MKIIHVIPNLNKGGAERLVQDICTEIYKRNSHEIKLITFGELPSKHTNLPFHQHINSSFSPSITSRSVIKVESLQQFIVNYKPDIIHSHLWKTEILLTKINSGSALRISHVHDNISQLTKIKFPLKKTELTNLYERKIFFKKNSNNFICISNDTLKFAKRVLPKKKHSKTHLLPNAINYNSFFSKKKKKHDKINLINIGSFVPKKNQIFALKILKKIIDLGHPAKLTFLGDGPLKKSIKNQTKKLKLENHVIFMGNVENVTDYLENSNIYLHTAHYEPFGLVLLEAMAGGLPVVSLDGGGNRDFINNDENGYLLNNENQDEFANKIIKLFYDKIKYKKFVQNGHTTAKKHDIKNYVDRLLEIYLKARH
jgi:glycosyltransferase involved in cell wall biosynthesis